MNSSGIKRGLAATAISALAVTGVPFLATSASATPITADYAAPNGTVTAADLELLNPDEAGAEVTTAAYTLVAAGNTDVAQVLFQFSPTGAAPWTNIGAAVSRVNGAFVQSWTPSVSGSVRAVPISASGDLFEAEAVAQTVSAVLAGNADTAKIGGDTATGVWNTKPTAAGANAYTIGVTGTTSLTDTASPLDDGYRVVLDARTGVAAASTANADVVGATNGTFAGVLPLNGYVFTPGGPDEIVVGAEPQDFLVADGARANVEDAAVKTLYLQQPGTVTAVAASANLQPGQTTNVTVTALDQNGKPIAGATIYKSANGGVAAAVAGTTGADGKLVDNAGGAGLGSGSYKYFINAPAGAVDNPQTTEEAALGDKSSTVAIAVYTPALTGVTVTNVYGTNADIDEVDPGTPFTAKAVDQNGNPMGAEQLYYTWTVDPFDPAAPTLTSNEKTAAPTSNVAGPNKGTTAIEMANLADFTTPLASLPSGVWTLKVYRKPVGGIGAFNAAPVDFKFGESKVTWDPSDVQAALAGSATIKGTLALEDGTAIGSIDRPDADPLGDVNRTASLTYVAGLEDNPATPAVEALPGDSRIAPILEQDGTVTSVAAGGLTGAVKFNASGVSNVKVNDATPETNEELNAALTADPTGALSVADGATDNKTVQVDFLTSVVASAVVVNGATAYPAGGTFATPGRPAEIKFKVTNASGQTLSSKDVTITVAGGGFITDNDVPGPLTTAQLNGVWANKGTTATVKTDGNGIATVTVAIERNAGFDDDFRHDVQVTATVDGKSAVKNESFFAQDAVDVASVEITPSADNTANLPDAQVEFETVEFDVVALDQFGNRTDEDYAVADGGNPRADVSTLTGDTQGTLDPSDLSAFATSATSQTVTVSVDDPNGAAADSTLTDAADAINWYVVDFAASAFTLGQQGPESVPAGTRVTEVLTVIDQKGQPVSGLWVDFLRAGPGPDDSDGNNSDATGVDGKAFYDFTGGTAGTARISAIVKRSAAPGAARVGTADDTVTFTGDVTPTPQPVAIQAVLKGANNGAKADVLKVKAPAKAKGAIVKLYKVIGGKRVLVGTKKLNAFGGVTFKVADKNKNKATKYVAVVGATPRTKKDTTNFKSVR